MATAALVAVIVGLLAERAWSRRVEARTVRQLVHAVIARDPADLAALEHVADRARPSARALLEREARRQATADSHPVGL